ncbi:amiloride-sensitive sodium channel [Desmophyllum pertusum]|uniref:Amiloride-sensitive sodium channel n=1 Tax=Desmophyllum pertusum TaxID=174260 RepID=A0A9W9YHJ7_9CNID|nr:amiloride-sensitive sodium channel [Desmophyllum pertusum]
METEMDKEIPEEGVVSNQETTKLKSAAIKRKWNHFIDNTTLHGMQYVFNGQTKVRSIIWAFFLARRYGILFFSILAAFEEIFSLLSYNKTNGGIRKFAQVFPAVTICNFNMLKKSYSEQVIHEDLLKYLFRAKLKEVGIKSKQKRHKLERF